MPASVPTPGGNINCSNNYGVLGRHRSDGLGFDAAKVLARLEARTPALAERRDEELRVVAHHGDPPHVHVEKTGIPGVYHVGLWIEGTYAPDAAAGPGHHGHGAAAAHVHARAGERFIRILSASVGLSTAPAERKARGRLAKVAKKTPQRTPPRRGARRPRRG